MDDILYIYNLLWHWQALDFVIMEAKKYRVQLILTLVNNYDDFGGRPQYVQWATNAGVSVNSDDDFYSNAVIKDYYKNHVKVCSDNVCTLIK